MRLSEEDVRGRSVIAADGQVIGEVRSILFNSDTWQVEAFQVTLRKDTADQLGTHRSFFQAGALELPIDVVQSVGATIILSVPVDGLRAVLPSQSAQEPAHQP
jgi:sporulation protein YlmC with PRC-barrel domain